MATQVFLFLGWRYSFSLHIVCTSGEYFGLIWIICVSISQSCAPYSFLSFWNKNTQYTNGVPRKMCKFMFTCEPANLIITSQPHIRSRPRVCTWLLPSIHSCRVNIHHCLTKLTTTLSLTQIFVNRFIRKGKLISTCNALYRELMAYIERY